MPYMDTEIFIKKATVLHNNKYDYSCTHFVSSREKLKIICPVHGEFVQLSTNHLRGSGCFECGQKKISKIRKTNTQFISELLKRHGDRYDYSKVMYKGSLKKITIICKDHGEFEQVASRHLSGSGCTKCALEKTALKKRLSKTQFIKKARVVHGEKYDYSKSKFKHIVDDIVVICDKHGEFSQRVHNHLYNGTGCKKCANVMSDGELEVRAFVDSIGVEYKTSSRGQIPPLELDIYVPSRNFAIEYNGIYWHSERTKPRLYHKNKWKLCKNKGIGLMQITDKQWSEKRSIIESQILYKLGKSNRIFARKCKIVKNLNFRKARSFYNEHHLQGAGICNSKQTHYALTYKGEHVMVLTVDLGKNYIVRLCTSKGNAIIGGASKLMNLVPRGAYTTYIANDQGGDGSHYTNVISESTTDPRYFWHKGRTVIERQRVQKHKLGDIYPDYNGSSETTWMKSLGYNRYFDSGNTKLIFRLS